MATSKQEQKPAIPDGFERIDQPDIEGWWKPEKGDTIQGRIIGNTVLSGVNGSPRDTLLIQLIAPAKAIVDNEPSTLEKGQVIGVSVRHKLKPLMHYVDSKSYVFIRATHKQKLSGGRTLWDFEIGVKGKRVPPPLGSVAAQVLAAKRDEDTSDIPF